MGLRDRLLEYRVDGRLVVDLFDYYEGVIKERGYCRGKPRGDYRDGLVLCYMPDHEDRNPSMGWVADRKHKGGKKCHCFGCGATHDVVSLHQVLRQGYDNVVLTEDAACRELAVIFGIDLALLGGLGDGASEEDLFRQRMIEINMHCKDYTIRNFEQDVRKARGSGNVLKGIADAVVKYTAVRKGLIDG